MSKIFGHWNLNSISPHNSLKLPLLQAYIIAHNFDVIGLSDSNILLLSMTDQHFTIKHGGACIYYKINLPLKTKSISCENT